MKEFVVVEFISEGTVDVVHQRWIKEDSTHSGFESYQTGWPPHDQARLARETAVPTSQWTVHPVRILGSAENYLVARERCKDAQYTSNLETDEDVNVETGRPIRKRRLVPHIVSSDEEEPATKRQTGNRSSTATCDLPQAPRTLPPVPSVPLRERDLGSSAASTSSSLSPGRNWGDIVLERKILTELTEMRMAMEELKRGQRQILNKLKDQPQAQDHQMPTDPGLPHQTVQDVDTLEGKLDDALQDSLIRTLSFIGGTQVRDLVRRIMRELMTDKCARNFNWKGNNPLKFPFQKLKLCSGVTNAVKRNPGTSAAANADIESRVKEWLRFAPERDGGRKEREERKKRGAAEGEAEVL